jgi:hypothetical protein
MAEAAERKIKMPTSLAIDEAARAEQKTQQGFNIEELIAEEKQKLEMKTGMSYLFLTSCWATFSKREMTSRFTSKIIYIYFSDSKTHMHIIISNTLSKH